MAIKAVTNTQLNDFIDGTQSMSKFLDSTADTRVVITRMLGEAALKNPTFAGFVDMFGARDLMESATVQDSSPQVDLDKVWHGLHWIFTGTADGGPEPLCYLMDKGVKVGVYRDCDVRGFSSMQLGAFEAALQKFDEAEVRRRYNGDAMAKADLYLSEMWRDKEEGIDALMPYLTRLKEFLKEAKSKKLGMLIWLT